MYQPIIIRGREWQGRERLRRSGKVAALRKRLRIETARFERSQVGAGTGNRETTSPAGWTSHE